VFEECVWPRRDGYVYGRFQVAKRERISARGSSIGEREELVGEGEAFWLLQGIGEGDMGGEHGVECHKKKQQQGKDKIK
jgi:hypothetical protein